MYPLADFSNYQHMTNLASSKPPLFLQKDYFKTNPDMTSSVNILACMCLSNKSLVSFAE